MPAFLLRRIAGACARRPRTMPGRLGDGLHVTDSTRARSRLVTSLPGTCSRRAGRRRGLSTRCSRCTQLPRLCEFAGDCAMSWPPTRLLVRGGKAPPRRMPRGEQMNFPTQIEGSTGRRSTRPRRLLGQRVFTWTAMVYAVSLAHCASPMPLPSVGTIDACACCGVSRSITSTPASADDCCDDACACCQPWAARDGSVKDAPEDEPGTRAVAHAAALATRRLSPPDSRTSRGPPKVRVPAAQHRGNSPSAPRGPPLATS